MPNILWIDIETTGLGDNSAIIEIAAVPMIDGEIGEHFHSMIKPHDGASLDKTAFEVTNININDIWTYPEPRAVLNDFIKWIDKHEVIFHIGGHNVMFDRNKLFKFFCRYGEYGSFITRFNNTNIDTIRECRSFFKGKKNKPINFKLESVCQYFKTESRIHHRALGDVLSTIDIYKELEKLKEKEVTKEDKLSFVEKRQKYLDMKYIQMNPEGDIFITTEATKDKGAMRFILNHLYEMYVDQ